MPMRLDGAIAVAGALLLAGCLGASNQPLAANTAVTLPVLGDPLLLDHDHADPALHALATPNLKPLAHLAWPSVLLDRYPAQAYGEIDVEGDLAFVAALVSGFAIVDIADPEAPKTLSFTPIPPVYVADIKAAEGGDLVILGTQRSVGRVAGALGLPNVPVPVPMAAPIGAVGLQAWDATDKASPQLVGYLYVDNGCHMVSVLEYDDGTYVFCAPNDNTVRIFRAARQGPAVVFEPVALWSPGDLSEFAAYKVAPTGGQFTHDMTAQRDPLTGDPVMFVSFWDLGVHVVDVKDPANPALLGAWAGEDATLWDGKTHTAMAAVIGGKRVVVEVPEFASVPAVFVLDATDYGSMRLLAEWTAHPDGDFGEEPTLFSTHNFQLVGSKLYLAMYHGGVWVLDLAEPAEPRAIAYYLPAPAEGEAGIAGVVPNTWDIVVANGHMLAVDIPTGLHVLHLDGDPADAAYDSFA